MLIEPHADALHRPARRRTTRSSPPRAPRRRRPRRGLPPVSCSSGDPVDGWAPSCAALGVAVARRAVPAREHDRAVPGDVRLGDRTSRPSASPAGCRTRCPPGRPGRPTSCAGSSLWPISTRAAPSDVGRADLDVLVVGAQVERGTGLDHLVVGHAEEQQRRVAVRLRGDLGIVVRRRCRRPPEQLGPPPAQGDRVPGVIDSVAKRGSCRAERPQDAELVPLRVGEHHRTSAHPADVDPRGAEPTRRGRPRRPVVGGAGRGAVGFFTRLALRHLHEQQLRKPLGLAEPDLVRTSSSRRRGRQGGRPTIGRAPAGRRRRSSAARSGGSASRADEGPAQLHRPAVAAPRARPRSRSWP